VLSDAGVPIEQIARLVGHTGGSTVTETVYRKQLRPVIEDGATVMDRVFGQPDDHAARRPTRQQQPGLGGSALR